MRCLFVTAYDHFYGKSGGGAATRALKARFDDVLGADSVDVCCFDGWCQSLPRRLKQVLSIGRSLVSDLPSRSAFILPIGVRRELARAIARHHPDLVVINGGDVWPVIDAVPAGLPTIVIAHNVELLLMRDQVENLTGIEAVLRPVLRRDVDNLRRLEDAAAVRAGNVLSISADDAGYFRDLADGMNVTTFLPTFDYPAFAREEKPRQRPLHVGYMAKMTWWPNRQGADWFADRVLAKLPETQIVAHFYGAGSEVFAGRRSNLQVHGFVDDLSEIWRTCDLMICPIQAGSVVNIKFVEALYNRMPVLATRLAARGIPPIEDAGVVYLDRPEEWVEFLASPRALETAAGSVSADISDRFRPEAQRRHIADFVDAVMARTG